MQGERLSCLYDSLTAMAVADMLKAGYGVRGAVGSGDRLEVTGRGRVAAETLMSHDALRERMDIHGKYVGTCSGWEWMRTISPFPRPRDW